MERFVLNFNEIDKTCLPDVGGKGANLGEMTKAGFPVPQGFTTWTYRNFIQNSLAMKGLFDQLEKIKPNDLEQICKLGQSIREHLCSILMPEDIQSAVFKAWQTAGKEKAYAVRSR